MNFFNLIKEKIISYAYILYIYALLNKILIFSIIRILNIILNVFVSFLILINFIKECNSFIKLFNFFIKKYKIRKMFRNSKRNFNEIIFLFFKKNYNWN